MNKKILIVCPKKAGNTYKVAEWLATKSKCDLLVIENKQRFELQDYEHIVLCSGVYGDKLNGLLSAWMRNLQVKGPHNNLRFHVFLTWFGRGISKQHAMEQAERILKDKNLNYNANYGSCYGGHFFIRKGHPDEKDLEQAFAWMNENISA